ncbi:MAG: L-rhamnose isomerase [Acholeplasmataceae bacterium]
MSITEQYQMVKEKYKEIGVDTDLAIQKLDQLRISIQCWQGDDVAGFLQKATLSGGIQVTGNYQGRARDINELKTDLSKVLSLVPGHHKINLHAIYADIEQATALESIKKEHFDSWIAWAKKNQCGLDFNPTLFSHPLAKDGLTLSHPDENVRHYWIEHVKNTRKIADYMSKSLNDTVVHNIWIPDGFKDYPYHRLNPRNRLKNSLDDIFKEKNDNPLLVDTLESKLFGIGVEGYTVGSNEFYLSYALKNNVGVCIDSGHFHPTEEVSDKLSAIYPFVDHILLHLSRPMRWDSDHVVSYDDALKRIAESIVRENLFDKIHVGLDYFDASINRIVAWVVGIRNVQKAFLKAMLEPNQMIEEMENNLDFTSRLVWTEELKTYPMGIVYDYYCHMHNIPLSNEYLNIIKTYENNVLDERK